MSRWQKIILIIGGSAFCIFFLVIAPIISKSWHAKVRSMPRKYIYENFHGVPNVALVIEDLDFKDSLMGYYDTIIADTSKNPVFNFPLKAILTRTPIYVMGYTNDGKLADVINFTDKSEAGDYDRFWVYVKTLHDKPPVEKK